MSTTNVAANKAAQEAAARLKLARSPENMSAEEARKIQAEWGDDLEEKGPEWWIMFGDTRSGKSYQYLAAMQYIIEKEIYLLETPVDKLPRMFVLNLDLSGPRDLENYPMLKEMGVIKQKKITSFDELMTYTHALVGNKKTGLKPMVKEGDWIVVDRASTAWKLLPDYYTRTRLNKAQEDLEYEYYSSGREGTVKTGSATLQYFRDGINPLWHTWDMSLRLSPAHVIQVATVRDLATEKIPGVREKDDVKDIATFGAIGVVPHLQSDTWPNYHSQLFFSHPYANNEFFVRTMGDRGKRRWLGQGGARQKLGTGFDGNKPETRNFGELYLGDVCGWDAMYEERFAEKQAAEG